MDQTQKAVNHGGTAMGTMVSMTVYPLDKTDQDDAKALIDMVMAEVERLENECLSRRVETAEIFQLNENAGNDQGRSVSPFLESVLEESLKLSQESDGAFDISVGALSVLWNIDAISAGEGDANIPAKAQIAEAMARCGYEKLTLQGGKAYLKKGTILDLGSIGKGLALDQIHELLDARAKDDGIKMAGVFSMGGSVLTYGDKPNGKPWNVAIIDPADPSKTLGTLALKGGLCVSTSGDYERYFERDGVRYHHILDPSTGYPVGNGIHGVTIVSESGFLSDALSTACFVLGPEKGMELAERHHAAILMAGDQGQIWMNDAMKGIYSPSK